MKPWETDETFLSRWLSGDVTAEEQQAFEASPEYASYVATSQSLEDFEVGPYDEDAALGKVMDRIRSQPTQKAEAKTVSMRRIWYYAAAAVVAFLVVFVLFQLQRPAPQTQLFAESRAQISLPDGSTIDLQAGSLIRYAKEDWEAEREVFMEGEAYFDVEKGEKFEINLKQGKVTILGTTFQITEKEDTLQVTCFSGKVKVQAFGYEEILTPGQSITAIKDFRPLVSQTALTQPIWLSDHVQLQEVPLAQVIAQLEEIYGIQFQGVYDQEELFNGAFPVNDLNTALSQVLEPFRLEYQLDTTANVVTIR